MRSNERKGAWTLLVCVLLFGALFWGLGGRRMRESRNSKDYEPVEITMYDSVSVASGVDSGGTSGKRKNVKRQSKKRKSKSSGQQAADAPYRDILADTIASTGKSDSHRGDAPGESMESGEVKPGER
ncbi:MAG: hypothetical protein K2O56_05655 [Muribaculaceae bacterium]|nr:hypothetical protein [Muribaculaceae bacterium]